MMSKRKIFDFSQIVSTNVWRSVWRICMWILGLNGLNLLMIRKKNSVLIFQPKIFLKNTLTDQDLTFPFKKHEIFGGVLSCDNMGDFFGHAQEVKGCDFS